MFGHCFAFQRAQKERTIIDGHALVMMWACPRGGQGLLALPCPTAKDAGCCKRWDSVEEGGAVHGIGVGLPSSEGGRCIPTSFLWVAWAVPGTCEHFPKLLCRTVDNPTAQCQEPCTPTLVQKRLLMRSSPYKEHKLAALFPIARCFHTLPS